MERRAQKLRRAKAAAPADLDRVCVYAAELRSTAPPVQFPVHEDGSPAAPLPNGFSLPFLSREEIARGVALRAASTRAPSPRVEVRPAGGIDIGGASSSGRWEARIKPDGAEVVLITRDGSLPRPGNPSARSISGEGGVVPMLPGSQLFAAAVTPGMRRSDVIVTTVASMSRRPKVPAQPSSSMSDAGKSSTAAVSSIENAAAGPPQNSVAAELPGAPLRGRTDSGSGEDITIAQQPPATPTMMRRARGKDPAASFRASLGLCTPGGEEDSESDQSVD